MQRYQKWLRLAGYSDSTRNIYGCAARLAISQIDKPYWQISENDFEQVRLLIASRYESDATRKCHLKGLSKLAEFLRQRQCRPRPEKQVNWPTYLEGLPMWLAEDLRRYIRHRQRAWLPETYYESTRTLLSRLTLFLRCSYAGLREENPLKA